jgi:thioredoxin-dependent peroxiredoxin
MSSIQVGDRAPDFTAQSQDGRTVSLAEFRGSKAVVLFFYPRDGTAICTKEACSFRDAYEAFVDAGAVVLGVSADSAESHQAFASNHRLPFALLADEDGSLRRAFGVPKTMGMLPGRVTYVIDKEGVVRHVFNSQFAADRHVSEALAVIRRLAEG